MAVARRADSEAGGPTLRVRTRCEARTPAPSCAVSKERGGVWFRGPKSGKWQVTFLLTAPPSTLSDPCPGDV